MMLKAPLTSMVPGSFFDHLIRAQVAHTLDRDPLRQWDQDVSVEDLLIENDLTHDGACNKSQVWGDAAQPCEPYCA
jgi:hypothetical protein